MLAIVFVLTVAAGLVAGTAAADGVEKTIVAKASQFHLDSEAGPASPTITISQGDELHLRIENHEAVFHTFTFPHFQIDLALDNGSASQPEVIFVNITTTSGDVGKWQFWCRPHSSGSNPENRQGMVGWVDVRGATPPTPGFETLAVLAAIVGAGALVATGARVRRR